jgi:hypothetical protein
MDILQKTDRSNGNGELVDDQAGAELGTKGRGVAARRRRRLPPGEKPRECKLTLPESVFERLRQTAIKRKTTMSIVGAELLNRGLPYFEVIQKDKPPTEE